MLALSACFSPWTGDGGVLTLYMGSGPSQALGIGYNEGGNVGPDPADIDKLDFSIHLSGPGGSRTEKVSGAGPHQLSLPSGNWTVRVEAFYQGVLYAESDPQTVNIGSGGTSVSISLGPAGKAWNEADFGPGAPVEYRYFSAADAALPPGNPDSLSTYLNNLGGTSNKNCVVIVEGTHTVVPAGASVLQVGPTANNLKVSFRGSGTIALDPGSTGTIVRLTTSTSGNKFILRGPTLKGHAGNTDTLVDIGDGDMDMYGGAIIDNTYNGRGGGVYFNGTTFKMTGGKISNNTSNVTAGGSTGGAGVFIAGGNFTMSGNAEISNNSVNATGSGSGVGGGGVFFSGSGTFTMSDSAVISGNTLTLGGSVSGYGGGGVYVSAGTFNMTGGAMRSNQVDGTGSNGGGVYVAGGTFTMSNSAVISANTASNAGGGVAIAGSGKFEMSGGTMSGNKVEGAASMGGGVYVNSTATPDAFKMSGGVIRGSVGAGYNAQQGGGVYVASGTFTMNGTAEISGNKTSSASGGGGVLVSGAGNFKMEGGAIRGGGVTGYNATSGGGVVFASTGTFTMSGGEISGHTTNNHAGGVYFGNGTFNMSGGNINSNSGGDGGGVYVYSGTFTMSGGTISGNTATDATTGGGGVYLYGGTFNLNGGTITGNNATYRGGGVNVAFSGTFKMVSGIISGNTDYSDGVNTYTKNIAKSITDFEGAALYTANTSSTKWGPNGTETPFSTRVESAIHIAGGGAVAPGPTGW